MTKSRKQPSLGFIIAAAVIATLVFILGQSGSIIEPRTSPANACINDLREIDAAKMKWASEHNAKANDAVALEDIKPYLVRYGEPNGFIKLDAKGNLPKCPEGGTYTIGKIGEPPTCSLSNTVMPPHVLP